MTQKIIPYVYYEDGTAALEFLCKAFGFEERMRMERGDGSLMHAEVGYQDNVVMLGTPLDDEGKPTRLRDAAVRHSSVMCYVDDVDAHHARARAAGAKIAAALEDKPYGARQYTAEDPEGLHWHFSSKLGEGAE